MKAALFQPLFSQSWYTTQKLLFSLHHLAKAGHIHPLIKSVAPYFFCVAIVLLSDTALLIILGIFFCWCNIIKLLPSSFIWRASSEILLRNLKELKSSQMWHNLLKLRGLSILGILCISTVSKSGKTTSKKINMPFVTFKKFSTNFQD